MVDPGGLTNPVLGLKDVDAVVITHEHADHWTGDQLQRILDSSPSAVLLGPAGVAKDNAIFTGKENAALRIFLINAHVACRKRNAQAVFLFIFELVIDHHGILQRRSGSLLVVVIKALPVHDEDFFHGHPAA